MQIKNKDYPIFLGEGLLDKLHDCFSKHLHASTIVLITDTIVKKHITLKLEKILKQAGFSVLMLSIPSGERSKSHRRYYQLQLDMQKYGCDKNTVIFAVGGGVVGDLAGFVAATYMRGIAYIQVPTSLLAMVDSSIGGKTGIDTPYGKNLIGAYFQPQAVIADLNCLKTLPHKHKINGLIEAVKLFLTHDSHAFEHVEQQTFDHIDFHFVIQNAMQIKAEVVTRDPHDKGERLSLNFGHTIGHALECLSQYKILHGFAVASGILLESKIAQLQGILNESDYERIVEVFKKLNISTQFLKQYSIEDIIEATRLDKKNQSKEVHYVLLEKIGKVHVQNDHYTSQIDDRLVKSAFQHVIRA